MEDLLEEIKRNSKQSVMKKYGLSQDEVDLVVDVIVPMFLNTTSKDPFKSLREYLEIQNNLSFRVKFAVISIFSTTFLLGGMMSIIKK